jgi:hypothetical protein
MAFAGPLGVPTMWWIVVVCIMDTSIYFQKFQTPVV